MDNAADNVPLSRRTFIAATSAMAFSQAWARAATSRNAADLAAAIHPNVHIQRDELPRDANAFWVWKDAVSRLTSLHDYASAHFDRVHASADTDIAEDASLDDALDSVDVPGNPLPSGEVGKCVRAWLESSEAPLELIDRGIALARYQVPQVHLLTFLDDTDSVDDVRVPRVIARLIVTRCNAHLDANEPARAASAIADLLRIARMVLEGDGYLVHYLVALAIHSVATAAVNAYARHPTASRDALAELRTLVRESRPQAAALGRVFRMEVVYFMQREMSRLPNTDNFQTLVDALIQRNMLLSGDLAWEFGASQGQVERVRSGMLRLFEGHPKPFDPADTVRIYSGVVAGMLADLSTPWLQRKQAPEKAWLDEIKPWPPSLSYKSESGAWLPGEGGDEQSVSDAEIASARLALLQVHNPVGKLMLQDLSSFESVRRAYHIGLLRTDVALVLIACRQFRDERNRLPHSLAELVDARFLESVPLDPFSGAALRYDPNRRIVWSYGVDEKDDDGDGDLETNAATGNDIVWRVAND
jgi:hypothetical protein